MTLIYRVQYRDDPRNGPYQTSWGWEDGDHTEKTGRPSPQYDGIPRPRSSEYYGFQSLGQLYRWFTSKERAALKDIGYVLAVYSAPIARHGGRQSVFNIANAVQLRQYPLAS